MYCTSCGLPRPADELPCPACGGAVPARSVRAADPVQHEASIDPVSNGAGLGLDEPTRLAAPRSHVVASDDSGHTPGAPPVPSAHQPEPPAVQPAPDLMGSLPGSQHQTITGFPVSPPVGSTAGPTSDPFGEDGSDKPARCGVGLGAAFVGLLFLGLVLPMVSGADEALIEDLGESWPFLAMVGAGVLGLVDRLRGTPAGLGVVAGVSLFFVPYFGALARLVSELSRLLGLGSPGFGPGMWIWAAGAAVGVAVIVVGLKTTGEAAGFRAPPIVGLALAAAGAVWCIGVVLPPVSGVSVTDHLFTDDAALDVAIVCMIGFTAAAFLIGAVGRTAGALGLALGAALVWLFIWAWQTTDLQGSGESFGTYLNGSYAPWTIGVLATSAVSAIGLLVLRDDSGGLAPTSKPPVAWVAVAAVVLVPLLGVYGLASRADDSSYEPCRDEPWLCESGWDDGW